jgi:hypothetical protein
VPRRRLLRHALLAGVCEAALLALVLPAAPALADPHADVQPAAGPLLDRPVRIAAVELPPPGGRGGAPGSVAQVRAADHAGYSRVVFDFASPPEFTVRREGDHVVARFAGAGTSLVPGLDRRLRYVDGVEGGRGWAEIALAHGAVIRTTRLDKRVVIDVLPPELLLASASGPEPAATPPHPHPPQHRRVAHHVPSSHLPAVPPQVAATAPAEAAQPAPAPQAAPRQPVAQDAPTPPPAAPTDQTAVAPAPPPQPAPPAAAAATPPPPGGALHAVTLPFAATTGAAAFRRGPNAVVVFDEPRNIDLAGLADDSVFSAASLQVLPGATVLRVPLDAASVLQLTRVSAGWTLAVMPGPASLSPISPVPIERDVSLPASQPGQVVTVPDPDTGWNLLVGTQLQAGEGLPVARRTPAYVVLPTWQGVAVEPRSELLAMRPVTDGFMLTAPGLDLAVPSVQPAAQIMANAAGLTRRFDFPNLPDVVLLRRMRDFVASAGDRPPRDRYAPRLDAAQAMLALGLGPEAQSLLLVAATDEPQHADDPTMHGLSAIAALLAGRTEEADGLDDPALTGSDEVALWRAVRAAMRQEGSAEAAPVFAATLPLLLSYPAELRHRLLPLAAETMAMGGQADVAAALLARPESTAGVDLSYAGGLVAQAHGDIDGALAIFDTVAKSQDERDSARARRRAVELRLSSGRIGPAVAADALTTQFLAWHKEGEELALRERAASLYTQAGAWRKAVDLLHETMGLYEEDRPAIRHQLAQTFTAMLTDAAAKDKAGTAGGVNSLDLVTMVDENPDVIPPGPEGDELAGLLADRLIALDLPRRAAPVLDKLMRQAPPGAGRAQLGARLADLKLGEGDAAAALVALTDSAADDMPAPLADRRGLLTARAYARQGDMPKALDVLALMTAPEALDLRAQLLTDAKDWHGAEAALTDLAGKTLPADGPLSDAQQNLVLRLAGAAAQAGDEATLKDMAMRLGPRMSNKQLSDMFHLLTESPVTGMADMSTVTADIARAKALPASLTAVTAK